MLFLYSFLINLLTPLLIIRLYWKSRRISAYRQGIFERLSLKLPAKKVDIWFHAVSLGEVNTISPLIENLLAEGQQILLTTMTPTGLKQARQLIHPQYSAQFVPYDIPWVVKKFYRHYQPTLGVILETEIWPNLIYYAKKRKIPLLLINGRISSNAFPKYLKIKKFLQARLNEFSQIISQTEEDQKRFIALGAEAERVTILPNLKYQSMLKRSELNPANILVIKEKLGSRRERVGLMLASTHPHEEKQVLSYFKELQQAIPGLLLLIAPRHPERFREVFNLCCALQFKTALSSSSQSSQSISPDIEILMIDSIGELKYFYPLAQFAFVGGSLVPQGGHNILEPIALNIPTLCGPFMQNFHEITKELIAAQALIQINHPKELIKTLKDLQDNPIVREQLINNGEKVLSHYQNVFQDYKKILKQYLY